MQISVQRESDMVDPFCETGENIIIQFAKLCDKGTFMFFALKNMNKVFVKMLFLHYCR